MNDKHGATRSTFYLQLDGPWWTNPQRETTIITSCPFPTTRMAISQHPNAWCWNLCALFLPPHQFTRIWEIPPVTSLLHNKWETLGTRSLLHVPWVNYVDVCTQGSVSLASSTRNGQNNQSLFFISLDKHHSIGTSVCSLVCGFEVQQDGHEQQTYISELTPLDKEMRKNVLARDILQVLTLITRLFMINLQTILPDYP